MKKQIYLGIALAMSMIGCNNDDFIESNNQTTLDATVESDLLSRVGFDKENDWSFFWHNGDKIWVNESPMTTDAADKSKTASFKGYGVDVESGYAVYPYDMAEDKVNGTELTWNFPSSYSYTEADENFFDSAQAVPMYAVVSNGKASFKHLGAIAAFKFNSWEFTGEHVFTLTASKKISGEFTTDLAQDVPVFVTTEETEDVVTINYTRPADAGKGDMLFYVPLPTGTYDIKVRIQVEGETQFTRKYTDIEVKRADVVFSEYGDSSLDADGGDNVTKVSTAEALQEAINAGGEVTLAADITLTSPIIVEKDVTVNLGGYDLTGGVFAESNGTISEGTTDSYVFWVKGGTLTINGEGNVTASEAKYSMAVWANGGKVIINGGTYKNSYASDLIYAKGENTEVSIYGGTFIASNKNADTEDGTAEEYSALDLSDNSGAKITVYGGRFYKFDPANNKSENPAVSFVATGYSSVLEGDYYVVSQGIKTETALLAAIANGGEVTLAADITVENPLNVTKDVTLVLAEGVTLTGSGLTNKGVIEVGEGGNLTIQGTGTIVTSSAYPVAAKGGTLNIEGGSFTATNSTQAVYVSSGTANISGGYFDVDSEYNGTSYKDENGNGKYVLNCYDTNYKNGSAKINVTGGKFKNFDPANNAAEGTGTNFVAEGYKSTENNGWYTVAAE